MRAGRVLAGALAALCLVLSATSAAAQTRERVDLIVGGAFVVTMEAGRQPVADGAVAVRDGTIVAVGPRADIVARFDAATAIDGRDRVVLPGLVNGHTHAAMTLFRGLADDRALMDWLQNWIFPAEEKFVDADFVRAGTRLACLEMIRGGTTTFVDMYFFNDTVAEVADECGLRAVVAAAMIDFPSPGHKGWDDSFASGAAFVRRWQGRNGRITPAFGPHAPYTVSPEHLKQVAAAARELGAPLTIHLAESPGESEDIRKRYGSTPVAWLDANAALGRNVIAAHVVWADAPDIARLAATGTAVIHNPTSNLKLASGIAPIPEMLAAGVRVGLGTDGAASNNDLDMWEEMRLAALLHKGRTLDPTVMPAATVLRLATAGGAEAVGLGDHVGSLVPGKRADLLQVRLDAAHLTPLYDVVSHLVYAARAADVVTTVVDGKVLMRDGVVRTLDEAGVRAAAEWAARISGGLAAGK
ncbi:MAG: amidohydrolase family protein [Alphaproteobacteria bacterium]